MIDAQEIQKLIDISVASEHWTDQEMQANQSAQLLELITHMAATSPHFKTRLESAGVSPEDAASFPGPAPPSRSDATDASGRFQPDTQQ